MSDVTFGYFLKLLAGEYGEVESKIVVAVNAFWTGRGEEVGTAVGVWVEEGGESVFDDGRVGEGVRVSSNEIRGWRGGNARAKVAGEMVFVERRRIRGRERVGRRNRANREMAEALNAHAGVMDAVGFNRNAADNESRRPTSSRDLCIVYSYKVFRYGYSVYSYASRLLKTPTVSIHRGDVGAWSKHASDVSSNPLAANPTRSSSMSRLSDSQSHAT